MIAFIFGRIALIVPTLYIEAARALGNPHRRIVPRHIFPNIVPPLLVQAMPAAAVRRRECADASTMLYPWILASLGRRRTRLAAGG